jgi:uncharacterized protein YoxC
VNLETLTLPLTVADKGFKAGLTAAVAGVTAVVGAMGVAIKATFDWANDMDKLGDVMGGTNKDLAALNFVARKSGVSIDTLAKGTVILSKGLVDANGKLDTTGKALKEWGINVFDANGVLKDQTTLLGDVSDKYATFSTQQEKVNFLTEVFGKSGADLIDFFDTLAAEGGIDAVTKKVEALGLAIDPGRYEQFNRNLEELKLIGLSLAVAFTEKVMPIFEDFVKWITEKGIPGFRDFAKRLTEAFNVGGLAGALGLLDTEVAAWLDSLDWTGWGTKLGAIIEQALGLGIDEVDLPAFAVSLGEGIKQFLTAAVGEENLAVFKEHFVDYIILQLNQLDVSANDTVRRMLQGIDQSFANWSVSVGTKIKTAFSVWTAEYFGFFAQIGDATETAINEWIHKFENFKVVTGVTFRHWRTELINTASTTMDNLSATISTAINNLAVTLENKLREIAKTFYNRAAAWVQQAIAGFTGQTSALLSTVSGLVASINAELKKIITSFRLTISVGTSSQVQPNSGLGGGGSVPNTTNTVHANPNAGRASGGPVIGGQTYNVAEFFKPERFTPAVNGRIDPIGGAQLQMVAITNWDGLDYSRLASEIVKAENNR